MTLSTWLLVAIVAVAIFFGFLIGAGLLFWWIDAAAKSVLRNRR